MTDKELLEMAAKAARIVGHWTDGPIPGIVEPVVNGGDVPWNPLWNSGQALELAIDLDISVSFGVCQDESPVVTVSTDDGYIHQRSENFPHAYRETRRAIVRAAAEIGKAMP